MKARMEEQIEAFTLIILGLKILKGCTNHLDNSSLLRQINMYDECKKHCFDIRRQSRKKHDFHTNNF